MKKILYRVLAVILSVALVFGVCEVGGLFTSKEEGFGENIKVEAAESSSLLDAATKLTESVDTAQEPVEMSKDAVYAIASANGSINKLIGGEKVPVNVKVTYFLNDVETEAAAMEGKSGKVRIRFDFEDTVSETQKIAGKNETVYVPFLAVTGMILKNNEATDVEVVNGKAVNDGTRTVVMGLAIPGLKESLGEDSEKIKVPAYTEVSYETTNFSVGTIYTMITSASFDTVDTAELKDKLDFSDKIDELTDAMEQLMNGSGQLYDGMVQLSDGIDKLADGAKQLKEGTQSLADGSEQLYTGAKELEKGIGQLDAGLNTIIANNDSLNNGAKQVFNTLLATANTQLAASGLSVPELTIDNYSTVLEKVLEGLDAQAVEKQARTQVEAAVNEKKEYIEGQVTLAVKAQVTEKVKAAVAQAMPAETPGFDQVVAAKVDEQMASDDVKALIAANTEQQIEKLIEENMNSEAVQTKLAAAAKGAASIEGLIKSLDSYATFYYGLEAYTDGVKSATAGADQLNSATPLLTKGLGTLADGAAQLNSATEQFVEGTVTLKEGADALENGSKELRDGIRKLNDEGISKLTELLSGDLKELVDRIEAIGKTAKDYAGTEGGLKYIYKISK